MLITTPSTLEPPKQEYLLTPEYVEIKGTILKPSYVLFDYKIVSFDSNCLLTSDFNLFKYSSATVYTRHALNVKGSLNSHSLVVSSLLIFVLSSLGIHVFNKTSLELIEAHSLFLSPTSSLFFDGALYCLSNNTLVILGHSLTLVPLPSSPLLLQVHSSILTIQYSNHSIINSRDDPFSLLIFKFKHTLDLKLNVSFPLITPSSTLDSLVVNLDDYSLQVTEYCQSLVNVSLLFSDFINLFHNVDINFDFTITNNDPYIHSILINCIKYIFNSIKRIANVCLNIIIVLNCVVFDQESSDLVIDLNVCKEILRINKWVNAIEVLIPCLDSVVKGVVEFPDMVDGVITDVAFKFVGDFLINADGLMGVYGILNGNGLESVVLESVEFLMDDERYRSKRGGKGAIERSEAPELRFAKQEELSKISKLASFDREKHKCSIITPTKS